MRINTSLVTFPIVIKILFLCICCAGLLYQLEQISDRYFRFQTRSEVQLPVPNSITVPIISTCWYLKDTIRGMKEKTREQYYEILQRLAIKEIFDRTPGIEYFLKNDPACLVRLPNEMVPEYRNYDECMKILSIERYIQRDFMCYKITVSAIASSELLNLEEYSLSPHSSGLLHRLFLNSTSFGEVSYFTIFAHSTTTSDLYDSLFARTRNYYKGNGTFDMVNLEVSFSGVSIERLEAPYDTSCRNFYPYESGAIYRMEGLKNETTATLGIVPTFSPVFDLNSPYGMITTHDLLNRTFLAKFNEIYKKYNQTYLDCTLEYYVSKYSMSFGDKVTLSVYWPQDSQTVIKHVPSYDLINYLLYVCSSFGIWLGISILSISDMITSILGRCKKTGRAEVKCLQEDRVMKVERDCKRLKRRVQIGFIAMMEYMKLRFDSMERSS